MGQVFLARHMALNRLEALKVLSPRYAKAKDFVSRLRRESRAASMLTHPNIVAVFGLGRLEDGRYYLAMEHLVGETLEAMIDRDGPVADKLGLRLLYQLASAMSKAHQQSVVHRDIKPANMMITDQKSAAPNLKVLDFGLAKITSPSYVDSVRSSVAGHLFGTPGFMAPERVQGVPSVPNMDVYSFGCVAYNMMTGHPPFVGPPMVVLSAHQSTMPPLPSSTGTVNKALEKIVMRCLLKDPEERPQDGNALCKAIEEIPGFDALEARRRSSLPASEEPAPATADTLRPEQGNQKTLVDIGVGPALAHTMDVGTAHAELNYYRELLALSKALIEAGCQDTKLVVAFGSVHQSEQAIEKHNQRLSTLFQEGEALEQRFRSEQSALRFELNELSFDAAQDGAMDRKAAEARANDITEDLVRAEYKFDRALQATIDAEVNEASLRESVEEKLVAQYTELLHLVDCNIESVPFTPTIESLLNQFQTAKLAYDQAKRKQP
jgi:hypothetical protein